MTFDLCSHNSVSHQGAHQCDYLFLVICVSFCSTGSVALLCFSSSISSGLIGRTVMTSYSSSWGGLIYWNKHARVKCTTQFFSCKQLTHHIVKVASLSSVDRVALRSEVFRILFAEVYNLSRQSLATVGTVCWSAERRLLGTRQVSGSSCFM